MFKIIEPEYHQKQRAKLQSLLALSKIYDGSYLSQNEEKNATYLIAEDERRGVFGGAILYPKLASHFITSKSLNTLNSSKNNELFEDKWEKSLKNKLSTLGSNQQTCWTARICFCVGLDQTISLVELTYLCESFFKNLHEALFLACQQKNISFLYLRVRFSDSRITKIPRILACNNWPHFIDLTKAEDSDGLVAGVLSFTKRVSNRALKKDSSEKSSCLSSKISKNTSLKRK